MREKLVQNRGKVESGMDRAAHAADSATKGRFKRQIVDGTDKAKTALGRVAGEGRHRKGSRPGS
ncbi:antitoxin [Streptomyces hoynatensis]|uniref:Antitoxin n=2 Tax=Streptomyces hoynatensis TaxID=1141874 RepID=A0A3A9YQ03_9ACTN|nr:antitoxin [Streptomyces hoynatensis]